MQRTIEGFLASSKQTKGYILRLKVDDGSYWKPEYFLSSKNAALRKKFAEEHLYPGFDFVVDEWVEGERLLLRRVPQYCDKETKGYRDHETVDYRMELE